MLYGGADSQLVNAGTYANYCLPVIRLKPLLNQVELVAGDTPRILREGSQVLKGGAYLEERFHGHEVLYKFLYGGARPRSLGAHAA
jgi:hypothetical protein